MSQASIDQFAIAHGLEEAGFDAVQAEAMVRAMNVISGSSERIADDVSQLKRDVACLPALKQDVAQLKRDVSQLKRDVAHLKQDVAHLKNYVKTLASREELERALRRQAVRMYAAVGASFAFTVGTMFTMLRFMLPGSP